MQYIKHYWIDVNSGDYRCDENIVEKRHPEAEFPGLDVAIWSHDPDGVDICISKVPDGVSISDITDTDSGKKLVQQITEAQFTNIETLNSEANTLSQEAMEAEFSGDQDLANAKRAEANTKNSELLAAIHAL
jgi:hypothetical protein